MWWCTVTIPDSEGLEAGESVVQGYLHFLSQLRLDVHTKLPGIYVVLGRAVFPFPLFSLFNFEVGLGLLTILLTQLLE